MANCYPTAPPTGWGLRREPIPPARDRACYPHGLGPVVKPSPKISDTSLPPPQAKAWDYTEDQQ